MVIVYFMHILRLNNIRTGECNYDVQTLRKLASTIEDNFEIIKNLIN